jgi:transposase
LVDQLLQERGLVTSTSAVQRALARLGLTRKKRRFTPKSATQKG